MHQVSEVVTSFRHELPIRNEKIDSYVARLVFSWLLMAEVFAHIIRTVLHGSKVAFNNYMAK
jgi:hypothetical protein